MYSFFVLGIIPGTNIAISFQVWLLLTAAVFVGTIIAKPRFMRYINENFVNPRPEPLHASQLHLRAL